MTPHRSDTPVEAGPQGPALTGTDNDALLQALRNLWPILSPTGRQTATNTAKEVNGPQ
jgi:hypothetical protein